MRMFFSYIEIFVQPTSFLVHIISFIIFGILVLLDFIWFSYLFTLFSPGEV